jgi:ElaB/YqjD/DUF883 family membrane-anchored ribosome-binding protein
MNNETNQSGYNKRSTEKNGSDFAGLASQAYEKISEKATETVDALQKETKEYSDMAAHYVQDNPVKALCIAAGIGALLALLLKK